jgi:hypothetical protein
MAVVDGYFSSHTKHICIIQLVSKMQKLLSIILGGMYSYQCVLTAMWARGSVVVKALCYKPEGRECETR